jgi:DNA-binding winged helix-turn-helix (wHTH) protein
VKHHFGRFILDTDARRLERANRAIHLTPKAFELLEILIAERPRAVAKQDLYDRLWPTHTSSMRIFRFSSGRFERR